MDRQVMRAWILAALLACLPLSALAEDFSDVELVGVYDGDTITVNLPGLPSVFGHRLSIRLRGIDAPELKGRCAKERTQAIVARVALADMLRHGPIELHHVTRDKYFRLDATVFAGGRDLNAYMLANGYARPYDGAARGGWCGENKSAPH